MLWAVLLLLENSFGKTFLSDVFFKMCLKYNAKKQGSIACKVTNMRQILKASMEEAKENKVIVFNRGR